VHNFGTQACKRNSAAQCQHLTNFATKHVVYGGVAEVFLKRTQILSGIQFTRHFIEFVVVETKQFVGSNVNVILMRQTCGQRSSRAAESKCWALEEKFPERNSSCYMFLLSKCRKRVQTLSRPFLPQSRSDPDSKQKTEIDHFLVCFAGLHSFQTADGEHPVNHIVPKKLSRTGE